MSTSTPNFFAVLGEDSSPAVGTGAVHLAGAPKVAPTTSSKKADVNPKADPGKARKRSPGAPSNDRILKENKDGGRANNRRVPVREGAPAHQSRRAERTDRQPRNPKRDTAKRTRAGWGDENQEPVEEAAGEQIAKDQEVLDAAEDAEFEAAQKATPSLTLEQYQQQQREIAEGLNTRAKKAAPPTNTDAAAAVAAERPSTAPEPRKKLSNKPRKETHTIELDASQAKPLVREQREPREDRDRRSAPRAPRGGKPAGSRGGRPARGGKEGREGREGRDGKDGKPAGARKPASRSAPKNAAPAFSLDSLPKLG